MKRILAALGVLMVLLSGCGSPEDQGMNSALAFRAKLLDGAGCNFSAEITADYGDKCYEFTLFCQADDMGQIQFAVEKPDTLAGITGSMAADGGKLTFDEEAIAFDFLAEGQLSPISAPWIFLNTLRSGYILSTCREEGFLRLTVDDSYAEDALRLDIWLEEDVPVQCEICHEGRRILTLVIRDFAFL